jgi:hypothetical protein
MQYGQKRQSQEVEGGFEKDSRGKRVEFLDTFELHFRVGKHLQIAKNEKARVQDRGTIS